MYNYLIIDDETLAHEVLKDYCELIPHLNLIKECYNAMEALEAINQHKIDLIFLDINMPKISGFQFLKSLPNPPKTIVTSAHKEYALEGYELNIVDYLLKPFSLDRFMSAVNKAIEQSTIMSGLQSDKQERSNNSIFLKGDKKHHQIFLNNILYIKAYGNYSKIQCSNQMIVTHESISKLEAQLGEPFLRVHKSYMISKDKITSIQGNRIFIKDKSIPIGQLYRHQINNLIKS